MKKPVRGVLFDLDDTLFDHHHATRCATTALREIEPAFSAWSPEELRRRHSDVLELVHKEVVAGRLAIDDARRERFRRLLTDAGGEALAIQRAPAIAGLYRQQYERNWRPVDGAIALMAALKERGVKIAIVTNNLTVEQAAKLRHCALESLVDALITSEAVGVPKPQPAIFQSALTAVGLAEHDTVMVGDAWDTDIAGALGAGIRAVWFNWRALPARDVEVPQIASLLPTEQAMDVIVGRD